MKPTAIPNRLFTVCALLFAATLAEASFQPALPINPITTWTPYADTGFAAPLKHDASGTVTSFTGFTAPLIIGDLPSAGSTQIAFKGYMARTGTVGTGNDEGIWSNADPKASGPPGSTLWMVAQESDTVSLKTLGFGGQMKIRSMQTTPYGGTLFTTNSSLDASPNFSVYEGGGLTGLAGAGLPGFANGGLAVAAHDRIAVWSRNGTNDGTRAWDVSVASSGASHTVTPAPLPDIHWTAPLANPRVQCSPAISYYGAVAHRARSTPASGFSFSNRDYIEAVPLVAGGFFPTRLPVVRAGDPAPTGEIFGIFHPVLMAIAGGPNIAPTVAWQMSSMNAGENSGSTLGLSIPYGTPMPYSNSLWCWRQGASPYAEIARTGQGAAEIPGRTIKSFYALHLVDDDTSWPDSLVFYGAILDNGKSAIYLRKISGSSGPVLTFDQLIATDSPGAPASMAVPAIYGGAYPIKFLYPWFSVDIFGNVLMKATLGGVVPPDQKQCLIAAKRGVDGHAMRMRAQSGSNVVLPTLSHGTQPITNFSINAHEQGTMGRGQSIFEQTVSALVTFQGGKGIYTGF